MKKERAWDHLVLPCLPSAFSIRELIWEQQENGFEVASVVIVPDGDALVIFKRKTVGSQD
ncbi:MAG: hypothetical protein GTN71_00240 [Anaerolineae bacterium]|nr:hypothetical protein [Anaerolineae bacterium]